LLHLTESETDSIFLNTSEFNRLLLSSVTSSINTSDPVKLKVMCVHAVKPAACVLQLLMFCIFWVISRSKSCSLLFMVYLSIDMAPMERCSSLAMEGILPLLLSSMDVHDCYFAKFTTEDSFNAQLAYFVKELVCPLCMDNLNMSSILIKCALCWIHSHSHTSNMIITADFRCTKSMGMLASWLSVSPVSIKANRKLAWFSHIKSANSILKTCNKPMIFCKYLVNFIFGNSLGSK